MMIGVELLIGAVLSVLLSGLAVWYRKIYLDEGKVCQLADALRQQKRAGLLLCAGYICAAAGMLLTKKELPPVELVQDILLWDVMLLTASIDLRVKKIPNKLILLLLLLRIVCMAVSIVLAPDRALTIVIGSLIGMAVGGGIILVMRLFSRNAVGAGDLKMFAVLGAYFGLQGLMQTMIYTLFASALVAIILLLLRKAGMRSTMPMAPFMLWGLTVYYILL